MQTDYVAKKRYQQLYCQVLAAIVIGIALGHFYPETGVAMKPLGDGVATVVAARWENELDMQKLELELNGNTDKKSV